MRHYQAPDQTLHCIDPAFVHLLPAGSVQLTDEDAEALRPVPPLHTVIESKKQVVREARKPVFYTLAGMQSEALAKGDSATATAIVGIQQALKDLPETDLSACSTPADVDAAFVAAWLAIAQSAPANVVSAFNEVLA